MSYNILVALNRAFERAPIGATNTESVGVIYETICQMVEVGGRRPMRTHPMIVTVLNAVARCGGWGTDFATPPEVLVEVSISALRAP